MAMASRWPLPAPPSRRALADVYGDNDFRDRARAGVRADVGSLPFLLHIRLRKSARDDLQLILFSALIMILMVSGTLVILFNLRARMM